ncbi:hypothetical protein HALLA_12640 [Halostagnicola larsenii XH-48]|uniref:DUF8159 domain-containing protein n=1 Tax=Halostagnicola larsenii XH-48 TaxID=797299 RepID=W0JL91_9EURY|nr:hypothetical protein [Halostagnicola larsenii]AHF99510.1 hypothetical protein HALLA_12640 [Halostagnicola larsenii XH-48]
MSDDRPVAVTLENRLMSNGYYVTDYEETDGGIDLTYEAVSESETVTSHEVGVVVRTVLTIDDEREDWNPGRLEVTSTTTDGSVRGRWHVEASWFRELAGGLSSLEFSERVLETVRTPLEE